LASKIDKINISHSLSPIYSVANDNGVGVTWQLQAAWF